MGKKQGFVRTTVGPHSSKNRDQSASHGSLLPIESEPKKNNNNNKKHRKGEKEEGDDEAGVAP